MPVSDRVKIIVDGADSAPLLRSNFDVPVVGSEIDFEGKRYRVDYVTLARDGDNRDTFAAIRLSSRPPEPRPPEPC
jgi:hypothetical protein